MVIHDPKKHRPQRGRGEKEAPKEEGRSLSEKRGMKFGLDLFCVFSLCPEGSGLQPADVSDVLNLNNAVLSCSISGGSLMELEVAQPT